MSNFEIKFNNVWLLFLLIPLILIALYSFFKVNKRFRYTRNRVISFILCIVCSFLSCFTVSGMTVQYDEKNEENELVVLVDSSFSGKENENAKNSFVKSVIDQNEDKVKVGVVKFGFDQVVAVEIGDRENAYEKYLSSASPDTSATDIEGALLFAKSLMKNPSGSKIVLLSDGIETDGDALKTVNALALDGIKIDVVNYQNRTKVDDIMPLEVILPNKTIIVNEVSQITLQLQSSFMTDAVVVMKDNDTEVSRKIVSIKKGINSIVFDHKFNDRGVHKITFEIDRNDGVKENNTINSYAYIDFVDNVLILQRSDEGKVIDGLFKEDLDITVKNISDAPKTYDEICLYDQVILANIANRDMPDGFVDLLHRYVKEAGGGLLTVGGTRDEDGKEVANVYNRADMSGTKYEELLPILAEDYTPPIAVVLVIDASGSMGTNIVAGTTKNRMEVAKDNAIASLDALDTRDYLGIVRFGSTASVVLPMTPVSHRAEIEYAITMMNYDNTGTNYTSGMNEGGMLLKSLTKVNKKHIIFISDGDPGDNPKDYETMTQQNLDAGVSTSTISYIADPTATEKLKRIATVGEGNHYVAEGTVGLTNAIKEDVQQKTLREFEYEKFKPEAGKSSSVFAGVELADVPILNGFFGTKLKKNAVDYMTGEYGQPIYAEWKVGNGKVGSFMCDLNKVWSSEFLNDANGQKILANIINQLFPLECVKVHKIEIDLQKENFLQRANIYSQKYKEKHIKFEVSMLKSDGKTLILSEEFENFSGNEIVDITLKDCGLYEYTVSILEEDGSVLDSKTVFMPFSYSKEYDYFKCATDNSDFVEMLAEKGNGKVIENAENAIVGFSLFNHKTFDPRYIFISAILCCFLLDLTVRKFKFKWLFEIIREKKNKRSTK